MFCKICPIVAGALLALTVQAARAEWNPPPKISRDEIVTANKAVMAMPEIKIKAREEIARIRIAEMGA